jgi:phospholipase/lecithinase/hemolysin
VLRTELSLLVMHFNPVYATFALLAMPMQSLHAESIYHLVVFGDSLSDNGNAAASRAAAGETLGNYAANAFTDGPQTVPATTGPYGLWIDQFAAILKVPDPQPFLVNTPLGPSGGILAANPSATNFAFASALAGNNPDFSSTDYLNPANQQVPGTTNQVALFLLFNGQQASPENFYVFWAGAENIYQSLGNVWNFFLFPVIAKDAADAIAANIATLASAGAKHFMWLNLPPLGDIPYVSDNSDPFVRDLGKGAGDFAALIFNNEMASDIASLERTYEIDITVVNTNSLFNSIVASPGTYGFVNVKDAGWCGTDGVVTCALDNPNGFLFWDELHPTTAANSVLAQFARGYIAGRFYMTDKEWQPISPR